MEINSIYFWLMTTQLTVSFVLIYAILRPQHPYLSIYLYFEVSELYIYTRARTQSNFYIYIYNFTNNICILID